MKLKNFRKPINILKISPNISKERLDEFIEKWKSITSGIEFSENTELIKSYVSFIKPKNKRYRIGNPERDRIETQLIKKRPKLINLKLNDFDENT